MNERIPIIRVGECAVVGAQIFNPNSWSGGSKGIIQSCWTEYSMLHHCVGQIATKCGEAVTACGNHIKSVQDNWNASRFDLERSMILSQQPDMHMWIEAFFSGIKTLLDLTVQLLTHEKVVTEVVHGFHKANDGEYGGRVLNTLTNNVPNDRKETAARAAALISQHKEAWIDQAVSTRDELIHPKKGMHLLMFHLEFAEEGGKLACIEVNPPQIESMPVDQYARKVLNQVQEFSSAFLALIREASNNLGHPTPAGGRD